MLLLFFFSSRRRHTRCALVTGVQTCALPIFGGLYARVDVADEESVSAGLDAAGSAYGITRLLVNCAGVAPAIKTVGKENAPHPLGAFRRAVEINLVGSFNVIAQIGRAHV